MIPANLAEWVRRYQIPFAAMAELAAILNVDPPAGAIPTHKDEAFVQSTVRLEAARQGHWLGRNNVGALKDATGRVVRYGLANDSAKVNERIKSGDLIGWKRTLITPEMVGHTYARFWSVECKRPGWRYSGDDRERAQAAWATLVLVNGGDAQFSTGQI